MFEELNLRTMAIELLTIDKAFSRHFGGTGRTLKDFQMRTFVQLWGSTSGGFEGIGGSAMTTQRTYVFYTDRECHVFFSSRYAYTVPYSTKFMQDVKDESVNGVSGRHEYLNTED